MVYDFIDRLWGESSRESDSEDDHEATMSDEESAAVERATDHRDGTDHESDDAAPSRSGPPLEEIDARLDELETELADNESSIRSIESSQEEMAETMADLDDTVRRLLGVYDQLTAAENPFTRGDGDGSADGTGGDGFGLVDEPADPSTPGEEPTTGGADGAVTASAVEGDDGTPDDRRAAPADGSSNDRPGETTTVGFEDLLEAESGAADEDEHTTAAADQSAGDVTGDDAAAHEESPTADAASPNSATDDPDPVTSVQLAEFPTGYAADLLAMEWLANMVETSGPAGALKALSFYEELGWISSDVADTLELYLSGPNLDDDVDPNCPVELTASDHAESYRYVLRLRALDDIEMTAE